MVSWNLDPLLIAGLIASAGLHFFGAARLTRVDRGLRPREMTAFYAGWLIAALTLISPLCPLSVSLFAARVGQHMILTLVAAPLVVAGRPAAAFAAALGVAPRDRRIYPAPLFAASIFAVLLWFWHAPVPYAATFSSTFVYCRCI